MKSSHDASLFHTPATFREKPRDPGALRDNSGAGTSGIYVDGVMLQTKLGVFREEKIDKGASDFEWLFNPNHPSERGEMGFTFDELAS